MATHNNNTNSTLGKTASLNAASSKDQNNKNTLTNEQDRKISLNDAGITDTHYQAPADNANNLLKSASNNNASDSNKENKTSSHTSSGMSAGGNKSSTNSTRATSGHTSSRASKSSTGRSTAATRKGTTSPGRKSSLANSSTSSSNSK